MSDAFAPPVSLHDPGPDWTCRLCSSLWPCPTRRGQLLALYLDQREALAAYLTTERDRAGEALPDVPFLAVHRQIVGWLAVRQPPRELAPPV